MKLIRVDELTKYDRDLPESCWDTLASREVYQGWRCMVCGKIVTDIADVLPHKCGVDPSDWEEVEVDDNGNQIEEE